MTAKQTTPKPQPAYMAFEHGYDSDAAHKRFVARFGHDPDHMIERNNMLLVGPITDDELSTHANLNT